MVRKQQRNVRAAGAPRRSSHMDCSRGQPARSNGHDLLRHAALDQLQVGFHLSDELYVRVVVHLVDLAVDDPQALLVVPAHAFQQLEELSHRHARGQDNQADAESVLTALVVQAADAVPLADQFDAEAAALLATHAPELLVVGVRRHDFKALLLLELL